MNTTPVNTDSPERPASRKNLGVLVCAIACMMAVRGIAAQTPAADSLAERLRRAEAAIAALQVQIAEQAQSGVKSRSGARIELSGRVMVNAFHNSRRVNNVDNPQFVQPDPAPSTGAPVPRGLGVAIRQTRLGLVVTVPDAFAGGSFTGDIDVDFYGGQQPSSGGRTFPLLRMRTARGTVRWSNAHLMIGQESPLISGLNPITLSAVGTPALATAGNLWLWLPQARVGLVSTGRVRLGIAGSVLAPTSGDAAAAFDTENDIAERSERPFLQARMHAGWGEGEAAGEVGCGAHHGWLKPVETVTSRAIACDAMLPLPGWLELRGEYFMGQALRGLGGGGIGQNFTTASTPLRTSGGWAQLNARPTPGLSLGLACGGDHPDAALVRRRNDGCAAHAMLHPTGPMFFGAEYRRLRTEHASLGRFTNDHVTLAAGFEF